MNRSKIFKRAWSAFKGKLQRGKKAKFASCLKWSWKVEKEEKSSLKEWNPRENFYRYYNANGGYVEINVKEKEPRGYYECHRYAKGDKSWARTGFYKLVNFSVEMFEQFKAEMAFWTNSNLVASKF